MSEDASVTWRDQLQPASFRGVAFKVESHDRSGGRRVEVHEYPLRDKPYPEDMGRKARTYTIEAYVIGKDYITQRDALIEAIDEQGPGTLVHRYYGQIRVQAGEYRVRESNREGGMAKFSITFHEAGDESRPIASIDTRQRVNTQANTAIAATTNNFQQSYSVTGVPGWVTDASQTVLARLDSSLTAIDGIDNLIAGSFSLPSQIASKTTGVIAGLSSLSNLNSMRSLWNFGGLFSSVNRTTPSRIRQANNQQAVIDLVERAAIIESARQTTTIQFDSQQDAIAIRDELVDVMDEKMLTADDETYLAMQDLKVAVVRDLTDRAAKLKQLRQYPINDTLPALVIAHQLYQDANRDNEIVSRNRIGHPGFVAGGSLLEVLNA